MLLLSPMISQKVIILRHLTKIIYTVNKVRITDSGTDVIIMIITNEVKPCVASYVIVLCVTVSHSEIKLANNSVDRISLYEYAQLRHVVALTL